MIEINNLTTVEIDKKPIKNIIEKVLKEEKKQGDLSIAFVGQGRIRVLNKKYRKKNRVTDVLAFPESKVAFEKFRVGPTKKFPGLGELVICLREVKKNAKKFTQLDRHRLHLTGFDSSFEKELARILIHGVLHLLGYEHNGGRGKAGKMEEKEKQYFKSILGSS